MPLVQTCEHLKVTTKNWDDLVGVATGINPAGSPSPPGVDTTDGGLLFASGATNIVAVILQLNHQYIEGENIDFHIHWCKTTSAVGTVLWEISYTWANNGAAFGAFSVFAAGTVKVADGDTADQVAIREWTPIAGAGKTISSILKVRLQRRSSGGADTYGANAKLLSCDAHIPKETLGSLGEYTKP